LSNPVPWQNWMAAYLGYTLRMRTLFRGWPIMVNDTHTRRGRLHCVPWSCVEWCSCTFRTKESLSARHRKWQPRRACLVGCWHWVPPSICHRPCTPSEQRRYSDTANSFSHYATMLTRSALGRVHLPPTTVFRRHKNTRRCFDVGFSWWNKIPHCSAYDSKPCVAATTCAQYGFSRCNKILRCSAYAMAESNPDPASGLWSRLGSKVDQFVHVPTPVDMQNVIDIHARVFQ